jgi:transposase
MSPEEIKHFLVIYDPETGKTTVRRFGTDYETARIAYARTEQENGLREKRDIVLLSADSLKTIKKTHSSYFSGGSSAQLKELLEH